MKSSEEVGDGGSSKVYKGSLEGKLVAVKELRAYAPRHASKLIAAYDELFNLDNYNVVKVLGLCPNASHIVLEYCEKVIEGVPFRTLADLLLHYDTSLDENLRIFAIVDVANGTAFA